MREIRRNYERDAHNLSVALQGRANDRTAQYIELNMLSVDSSSSQKELLKKHSIILM